MAVGAENDDGNADPAASVVVKKKKAKATPKKTTTATSSMTKPKAAAKPKKNAPPPFVPHPLWQQQLELIREMRKAGAAPVDLFGCSELGKRHATSPAHMRFQTLISSMLSSQTTDLVNEKAMARLYDACGITIEGLEELGEEGIGEVIKPVSFYTAKAANIIKVCKIVKVW